MAQITYSISINAGDLSKAIGQEVAGIARDTLGRLAETTANKWRDAVKNQSGIWAKEKDAYTRAVFGQSPLDVIAPIEIATDALDWLGAILLGIEALGEREAPDLESIKPSKPRPQ